MSLLIYWTLFALTVVFALGVLAFSNTVKSAISLVFTMLCIAANYLLMRQEFVAFIQIIVYAGAIMVVFLFVIMLLNLREPETTPWYMRKMRYWGGGLAFLFFFVLAWAIQVFSVMDAAPAAAGQEVARQASGQAEVTQLATLMVTQYIVPFLLTSVLLLVAVIGAIVMARRKDEDGQEIVIEEEAA